MCTRVLKVGVDVHFVNRGMYMPWLMLCIASGVLDKVRIYLVT